MTFVRILGLLVGFGFCVSAAAALERPLRLESKGVRLLTLLLLFAAVQSLLIAAAGLAGLLAFWPLTAVSAAGLALLRIRGWGRLPNLGPFDRSDRIHAGLIGAVLLSLVVKVFVLVPYTGDALMYHLPKIAEWIQAERFVWGINHDHRVWFSAGFELIETWWVVFLHHDRLIGMAGIQMFLIAVTSVGVLASTLQARPWLAAAAYACIPGVILNVTACGNDLAVAALTLAGFALVAAKAPRPLQAFPLLLAVGVKATGGFAALGVAAFALLRERPPRLARMPALSLIVPGAVLAAFWYVRNAVVAGHPLYPYYGVHGEFTWSGQQAGVDLESLQQTIQVLDLRLVDRFPYESLNRNNAGWGWALFPLGLPALLLDLRGGRDLRPLAVSFLIGAVATFSCVLSDDSNLRFVLWFPALLVLAVARRPGRLWAVAALLAGLLNVATTLVPSERRKSEHLYPPPSLPATEPIACVFDWATPSYRLYNRDYSRRLYYPRSFDDLRRSGAKVVYLFGSPEWAEPIKSWPRLNQRGYHEVR